MLNNAQFYSTELTPSGPKCSEMADDSPTIMISVADIIVRHPIRFNKLVKLGV